MPSRKLAVQSAKRQKHNDGRPRTTNTWSSRRKACDRCVHGKRRCDGGKPCSRCSKRGLECILAPDLEAESEERSSANTLSTTGETYDYSVDDFDIDIGWLDGKEFAGEYVGVPNSLRPDTTVLLPPLCLNRLVRRIRSCICTMAESAQTPFLKPPHRDSEPTDSFFDETLLVCCSYNNRTRQNRMSLNRTITRKYIKLTQILRGYMSLDVLLPALQATILFEIMLLFDEDASMRALAEQQFTTIEAAMGDLQQRLIEELALPTLCTGEDLRSRYSRWLLLESIRRIVIAHWIVKAAYTHLRDGFCQLVPLLCTLPITPRGDLWTATSEDDWWLKTQQEQKQLAVVPYLEAVDFWTESGFTDMDEFQVMLYEACKTRPATTS